MKNNKTYVKKVFTIEFNLINCRRFEFRFEFISQLNVDIRPEYPTVWSVITSSEARINTIDSQLLLTSLCWPTLSLNSNI
jgi:hypothetical protein